jgi:hypothetical protein
MGWWCWLLIAASVPAHAAAPDAPYYGPMKAWAGIGTKFGYKEALDKDGTWRVTATTRRGDAIDIAMYRAAEIARDQGFAYVELLGGNESRSPGQSSATLYIRPTAKPEAPTACRSKRVGTCYTVDVAALLNRLGGPDGTQPGVAIADHVDEHGRSVIYSGFGIGAASSAPARPMPPPMRFIPRPSSSLPPAKLATPAVAKPQNQGWTISD